MAEYFQYGDKEIAWLRGRDKRLAEVIDTVGLVKRRVIPDLFTALVSYIAGQQISAKAHEAVWTRLQSALGPVTPEKIYVVSPGELRDLGLSFRKAAYMKNVASMVLSGELDLHTMLSMSDEEVCAALTKLSGIGIWSAEMLMLFSMQRPNILSFSDYAIRRGLQIIYHHREINHRLFERYRRRFSPYCSVASLYIWAVAGGALETRHSRSLS